MRRKATPRRVAGDRDEASPVPSSASEPGDPATAELVLGYAVGTGGHGTVGLLAGAVVMLKRFWRWVVHRFG